MELKKVICMQCHNACRLASEVQGHRLVSVEPDETFPGTKSSYPITKGCPRRDGSEGGARSTWVVVSGRGGCRAVASRSLEIKLQYAYGRRSGYMQSHQRRLAPSNTSV